MKVLNITGNEIYNLSIEKGEGCYVIDREGKRYIDFESGVWALPLGHNNTRVNNVIMKQLSEISHTAYRYNHPIAEEAAAQLLHVMNFKEGKCLFLSSGSEAVDFAVKIVREISEKPFLLNLEGHYLSAYGTCANTDSASWLSVNWNAEEEKQSPDYETLLKDIPFDKIAAFVFEAGNASGNVLLPPKEFIQAIVTKVKEQGGWIVADEVTTGIGRTGAWYGFEHYDIQPDVIACGKGLGNGYPVSAVGICKEICELLDSTDLVYGQSHQNDPMACAVANEVLTVIEEMGLIEQSRSTGLYLKNKLYELKVKHSCIMEVRGIGLMCAIAFTKMTDTQILKVIHRRLFDAGFIVGLKPVTNVFRFYPPLIIEYHMIDDMIEALELILTEFEL